MKDYNNLLVTDPRYMETWDSPEREFEIAVFMKLSDTEGNTEKKMKSGKQHKKWNGKFNEKIEIIKKNQIKLPVLNEIKNAIENTHSKMDQAEERICEAENRNFETTQSEENKGKRIKESERRWSGL